MALSSSSRPSLRGRVLSRLPATLQATGGLKVEKIGGTWTFAPDWSVLSLDASIAGSATKEVWVRNTETDVYSRVSLATLIADVGGFPVGSDDFDSTGGANQVLRQLTLGGPITVGTAPVFNGSFPGAVPASPGTATTVLHGDSSWAGVNLTNTVSGVLPVGNGGVGASLAATGGQNQILRQLTSGGVITVGTAPTFNSSFAGAVPASPGTTDAFMRADGSWTYAPMAMKVLSVTGVNLNSAGADNAITVSIPPGYTKYQIFRVNVYNPSTSITTATAGLLTGPGGTGVAIANTQSLAALTTGAANTSGNTTTLTVNSATTTNYTAATLYFRVGTAQGSAATADVAIQLLLFP